MASVHASCVCADRIREIKCNVLSISNESNECNVTVCYTMRLVRQDTPLVTPFKHRQRYESLI